MIRAAVIALLNLVTPPLSAAPKAPRFADVIRRATPDAVLSRGAFTGAEYEPVEREVLDACPPPIVGSMLLTLWQIWRLDETCRVRVTWGCDGYADFNNVDEAWSFVRECDPELHPSAPYAIPRSVVHR